MCRAWNMQCLEQRICLGDMRFSYLLKISSPLVFCHIFVAIIQLIRICRCESEASVKNLGLFAPSISFKNKTINRSKRQRKSKMLRWTDAVITKTHFKNKFLMLFSEFQCNVFDKNKLWCNRFIILWYMMSLPVDLYEHFVWLLLLQIGEFSKFCVIYVIFIIWIY